MHAVVIAPGLKLYRTPSGWYTFEWDWNHHRRPDMLAAVLNLQTLIAHGELPPATGEPIYQEDKYRTAGESYEDLCRYAMDIQETANAVRPAE